MGHTSGSQLREIFAGRTGLAVFWLVVLFAGTIGAVVLIVLAPTGVNPAGAPRPAVQQSPGPAIVPIVPDATPPAPSAVPARPVNGALGGATAAAPGNSEDPQSRSASIPTAPQSPRASSAVPEPPPPAGPTDALPQVAMDDPATGLALPESRRAEDLTNTRALPVGPKHVTIHYPTGSAVADAVAKRLSTRLGVQAEMREEATVPRSALVRYVSRDDHSAAREAGKILGEMGYHWKIEIAPKHPDASSQGIIEIWLPNR